MLAPNASEDSPNLLTSNTAPKVTRFTLSNGIRVVNLHVEDATDVIILSYLPLGLATDGKARAFWSHLINGLTVRTMGPIDYKTSGAETLADNIRFDFIGNMDNWTQGLERHAKWLSELPFSAESLAEARQNVLRQFDYIEENLATHKLAYAAWNQVFRHGETDILMRTGIQSAQLSELQTYRDLHLVQSGRVLLCVIGSINLDTLKDTMEKQLGVINLTEKTLPHPTVRPEIKKDQSATWDINVTHYMETYAIPHSKDEDYPALYMASALLSLVFMQDTQLKEQIGHIFCNLDLITPEQTYLQINASLKPDADIEKVKQRISVMISRLMQPENNTQVIMAAPFISMQFSAPLDVKMVMQQQPIGVSETMVLGNIGVQWGMREYQHGDTLSQLAGAFANISAADVASVANRYLTEERRMTLVLTPRASE